MWRRLIKGFELIRSGELLKHWAASSKIYSISARVVRSTHTCRKTASHNSCHRINYYIINRPRNNGWIARWTRLIQPPHSWRHRQTPSNPAVQPRFFPIDCHKQLTALLTKRRVCFAVSGSDWEFRELFYIQKSQNLALRARLLTLVSADQACNTWY